MIDKEERRLRETYEKAVSAIPAGLKCETRNNCSSDNQRV